MGTTHIALCPFDGVRCRLIAHHHFLFQSVYGTGTLYLECRSVHWAQQNEQGYQEHRPTE